MLSHFLCDFIHYRFNSEPEIQLLLCSYLSNLFKAILHKQNNIQSDSLIRCVFHYNPGKAAGSKKPNRLFGMWNWQIIEKEMYAEMAGRPVDESSNTFVKRSRT